MTCLQAAALFVLGMWLGVMFGYMLACLMFAAKKGNGE